MNGKIYVIGGKDSLGGDTNTVYEYDPTGNTWTTMAAMAVALSGQAAAVVNNKIYVIGGGNASPTTSSYTYDPAANAWSSFSVIPTTRTHFAAIALNNVVYAIGGMNSVGAYLSSVDRYTP